ncbi:cytochrome c-type biogenesis protein CcsB [Arthrobacter sp. PvP102]|jgi:cytochrome c-type biogenesis protein CcsB|uniref:c-type cytochrome biogenesis protein CcsB n=1 Tax=unclassified Arthrobacter TaxID=235627 RepID=UPI0000527CDF|nr:MULTISPECIES: c-type cytochrome biogenesis protein CcsB [unclassified Arthrobacter]ABK04665.1 cytochrome c assembly protein [Arthrobacter sp. FB24]MBP1232618.1 cytochrome c-type biogenesis protein CcsB [Arthrobacter sp. PvP103]MBP1237753.1 cytochrome c-type biogenesis protein CcsB [Arthrobacter sp. PvP102]
MFPINETMGQYSELFMLLAAGTYTVAFIAFAWDLAKSSKALRAIDLKAAAAAQASASAAAKVPVGAGVGAGAFVERADASHADVDRAASDVSGPAGRAERPSSATGRASKTTGSGAGQTADGDMRYAAERRVPARVAVALTVLGAAIHAAGVVTRALGAGRVPWGNMYEFLTTGAFVAVAVFLLVLIRRDLRFLGTFVIGLAIIMLVAASVAYWTPVGHLVPALQSYWLIIHVSIAVMSSALFTLTFAMSALQLVQAHRQKAIAAGGEDKLGFMRLVPSALSLENLSYRINAIAFVGWTFTLMFGAIWAEKAWGRFWGWDTKEVWTFVIWVVYAGYLHARATRGWTGTRAAWLSIVGYLCVIFNFTIVNQFFNGLHSYSGL